MSLGRGFSSSGPEWPPPPVADAGARGERGDVDLPAEDPNETDEQPSAEETP